MEETLEWFMEPRVKTNSSIPQDDLSIVNPNLESGSTESITYSRDTCHPLPYSCHDTLYLDLIDQSTPPTSYLDSLDFHVSCSNCFQVQDGHIT